MPGGPKYLDRIFQKKPTGTVPAPPQRLPAVGTAKAFREEKLSSLVSFPNQPFKPYNDATMAELVKSVKENGVITPVLIRPFKDDKFQIICGHNRVQAAKKAGLQTIPVIEKNLDDDEAVLAMVESNLNQRQTVLPSEKAFAYKMQYEALKHQGKKRDNFENPFDPKLRTSEEMAKYNEDSEKQIRRYIALTKLLPKLLDLIDIDKLPFTAGVNLSYLSTEQQTITDRFFYQDNDIPIDIKTSEKLKEMSQKDILTYDALEKEFLNIEQKPKRISSIKLRRKNIAKWIPKEELPKYKTEKDFENLVYLALKTYFNIDSEG